MATAATRTNPTANALSVTMPIKVKAAPGVRVPIEGAPRKYITDAVEVEVTRTAYYIRRLKDGDLIRTDVPPAAPVQPRGIGSEA